MSSGMERRLSRSGQWLAVVACVLLAAWLRLSLMTDWLGYDECVNYMIGKSVLWSDFLLQYSARAHPPLSYLATKPFLALGASPLLTRAAALLAGLAGVAVLHFALREALKEATRGSAEGPALWIGTLLLGATPIFVQQSIQVRGYSLCLVFVWAGLWLALRIRASGSERSAEHVALAVLGLLAFFSEFGAIFHVAALSAVLYGPLLLGWLRQRRWRCALRGGAPQLAAAVLMAWSFAWQMGGHPPEYGHTRSAMYAGSLLDPAAVAAYIVERLPAQMRGILPNPWGLAIVGVLLLAFTPWVGRSGAARSARALAAYSLLALSLMFAASLLRRFPFGGVPRHGVAIFPGILLACLLIVVALLRARFAQPRARVLAGVATLAGVLPAFVLGLAGLRPDTRSRDGLRDQIGVAAFDAAPGPVITNFESRPLFSWWFLPDSTPRRMYADVTRFLVYDYGGVSVVYPDTAEEVLSTALFYARHAGVSWIFLSYRDPADSARDRAFFERALSAERDVAVPLDRNVGWILDTIVMRLERKPSLAGTPPGAGAPAPSFQARAGGPG
jgi:hypothetical protein